jgi:hypothetical protein
MNVGRLIKTPVHFLRSAMAWLVLMQTRVRLHVANAYCELARTGCAFADYFTPAVRVLLSHRLSLGIGLRGPSVMVHVLWTHVNGMVVHPHTASVFLPFPTQILNSSTFITLVSTSNSTRPICLHHLSSSHNVCRYLE